MEHKCSFENCNKVYKYKRALILHQQGNHSTGIDINRQCPHCKKVFTQREICLKVKVKVFSCIECGEEFYAQHLKDRHEETCAKKTCVKCHKHFHSIRDHARHVKSCGVEKKKVVKQYVRYRYCDKEFTRKKNCEHHMNNCSLHPKMLQEICKVQRYQCSSCERTFPTRVERAEHEQNNCRHGSGIFNNIPSEKPWTIKPEESTLETFFKYVLTPQDPEELAKEQMLKSAISDFNETICRFVSKYKTCKVNVTIAAKFNKASNPEIFMHDNAYLRAPMPIYCYTFTNIQSEILIPLYMEIMKRIDSFEGINPICHGLF